MISEIVKFSLRILISILLMMLVINSLARASDYAYAICSPVLALTCNIVMVSIILYMNTIWTPNYYKNWTSVVQILRLNVFISQRLSSNIYRVASKMVQFEGSSIKLIGSIVTKILLTKHINPNLISYLKLCIFKRYMFIQ